MKLAIIIAVIFLIMSLGVGLSIALAGPESPEKARSADEWAMYIMDRPLYHGETPGERVINYDGATEENGSIKELWTVYYIYKKQNATAIWRVILVYDAAVSRDAIPRRAIKIMRSEGIEVIDNNK